MQISTEISKVAVLSLRTRLGMTQDEFADEVGCSSSSVGHWEAGRAAPRGRRLRKLLDLCPDDKTRALFGIGNSESGIPVAKAQQVKGDAELERLFSDAVTGLNIIYEAAAAGHDAAREVLADLADKLTTRSGDWQAMKYITNRKLK
jgi:transcriptional regulator with XRE-family HTH domain